MRDDAALLPINLIRHAKPRSVHAMLVQPCDILRRPKRLNSLNLYQLRFSNRLVSSLPISRSTPVFPTQIRQQFEVITLVHGIEISNGHEDNSVLIVNDEPDQLTLMGSLLHKAGYSVLTAEDGRRRSDPRETRTARSRDQRRLDAAHGWSRVLPRDPRRHRTENRSDSARQRTPKRY